MHRRPVGPSGAEDFSLGAVLYVWNITVGWIAEFISKRLSIRWWSSCFGTSLYVLNATVGWTVGQGIGSSGAEGAEPWPLLLPNPKASDEPMPVPSVLPTVHFESFGHRTHPTHVELRASVHPTLWFWFLTRPIQAPLSFPSILLLQPCFHELSELDVDQGTWVWQPSQENTVLSPNTNPLWSLSNSKVSSCR
jgi:hypothetical protein